MVVSQLRNSCQVISQSQSRSLSIIASAQSRAVLPFMYNRVNIICLLLLLYSSGATKFNLTYLRKVSNVSLFPSYSVGFAPTRESLVVVSAIVGSVGEGSDAGELVQVGVELELVENCGEGIGVVGSIGVSVGSGEGCELYGIVRPEEWRYKFVEAVG